MGPRSTTTPPEVTVVIPTRDRWPFLRLALGSAFAQRDVDLEVVVVDEASSDETQANLAAIDDPRLIVVRHPNPRGPAAARNRGIEEARGAWIAFLDDDDMWAPEKLRSQLDHAALMQAAFVYTAAHHLDAERRITRTEPVPPPSELRERLRRTNAIPAGASNMVISRALLEAVGHFDPRFMEVADWDLWLRCARADHGAAVPEALVGYVHHAGSLRSAPVKGLESELELLRKKHGSAALEIDLVQQTRWVGMSYAQAGRRHASARAFAVGARAQRNPGNAVCALGALLPGRAGAGILRSITGIGPADAGARRPTWLADVVATAPPPDGASASSAPD